MYIFSQNISCLNNLIETVEYIKREMCKDVEHDSFGRGAAFYNPFLKNVSSSTSHYKTP